MYFNLAAISTPDLMLIDRYKKIMVLVFDDWCEILQAMASCVQKARLKYFYSYASSAA